MQKLMFKINNSEFSNFCNEIPENAEQFGDEN